MNITLKQKALAETKSQISQNSQNKKFFGLSKSKSPHKKSQSTFVDKSAKK